MTTEGLTAASVTAQVAAAVAAGSVKLSGDLIQTVTSATGAIQAITTSIPGDDTIPQSSEGTQILSVTLTPANSANLLEIEAAIYGAPAAAGSLTGAFFQDANVNALAAGFHYQVTAGGPQHLVMKHIVAAGTTSATTIKLNVGHSSGSTFTLNGVSGGRYFGGVLLTRLTVRELKA